MWIIYILAALAVIAIIPAAIIFFGAVCVLILLVLGISKALELTIQDINHKDYQ